MNTPRFCYFDNNATTRVLPEVLEAMLPFFTEQWGNPSSAYHFGHHLTRPLDTARSSVAGLIGAEPREIVFTSCGTESINSALNFGAHLHSEKKHLIISAVEHSATMKFCRHLEKSGVSITRLQVESDGMLDLKHLEDSIRPDTAMVSLIWANNETGVVFPIAEAAKLCRKRGILFHTDAVQAVGKIPVDVKSAEIDLLSLSGHKLNAPKGVGALYIRRGIAYEPYVIGGGQERGRRGGTENVPYIVGLGLAAQLAMAALDQRLSVQGLRDRLEAGILERIPKVAMNGSKADRLPNTSNLAFEGTEAEAILMLLDQAGICASSGSACTTGSLEPSHVLTAMGCSPARARSSIRFSLGRHTTQDEVDYLLSILPGIIQRLREAAA
jgi:cysteine desulfurase